MTGSKALVPIIVGSRTDLKHAEAIAEGLKRFEIECEIRIASAHKVPKYLLELLEKYEAMERPKVYVTIAGRSNALSGMVDAQVTSPVIACPPITEPFGTMDLVSSLSMPSGVAPAVIVSRSGAALLAAKIIALSDSDVRKALAAFKAEIAAKVLSDDGEVSQSSRGETV